MSSKHCSYTAAEELKVVRYAETHSNHAAVILCIICTPNFTIRF